MSEGCDYSRFQCDNCGHLEIAINPSQQHCAPCPKSCGGHLQFAKWKDLLAAANERIAELEAENKRLEAACREYAEMTSWEGLKRKLEISEAEYKMLGQINNRLMIDALKQEAERDEWRRKAEEAEKTIQSQATLIDHMQADRQDLENYGRETP